MKSSKQVLLTFAEKSKNILASNWEGVLNTIKADAKGSKEDIHSSKVKYLFKKGRAYIWIPEKDLHNVNVVVDERASLSVINPIPGPLANLLKSIQKLPTRVALTGDIVPVREGKIKSISERLQETVLSEQRTLSEASYSVYGVLSSSSINCTRCENLLKALTRDDPHEVYKFDIRSWTYINGDGVTHEVDLEDIEASKTDSLSSFSAKLIDGINQSEARRRALMLFCFVYLNSNARDALMLSIDRQGFDVLGKAPTLDTRDGVHEYQWKEFRFTFKEEAGDLETFCRLLVEMEEEALKSVSSYSGLG